MQYFQTEDGLKLAYDIQGEGIALLCLAGLTRNMDDFDPIVDHFSGQAKIIRMDSRGRGSSDYAEDPMSYNVRQEALDVIALLDHLNLEKVAILGTSRGGFIAMSLAAMAPTRLSGICLNDIGPELAQEGLETIMDYVGKNPNFKTIEEAAKKLPELMAPEFTGVSEQEWERHARCLWTQTEAGLSIRYDPKLREAALSQFKAPAVDLWPLFQACDPYPLALIRGENSSLLTEQTAAKMLDKRPDMIFVSIKERGHVPFLSEENALMAIQHFLESIA